MSADAVNVLAIDTATEACSAAVLTDGAIHERFEIAPQRHAELILPMIEAVLAAARLRLRDMHVLAFGRGPGAFTGVRIGTAVMQGIALGTGLRLVPVSSLATLACDCGEAGDIFVLGAFDARRDEVYLGGYQIREHQTTTLLPEQVCAPASAPALPPGTWVGAGSGFAAADGLLARHCGQALKSVIPDRFPRARHTAWLARGYYLANDIVDAAEALPSYIRDEVAHARAAGGSP
ncbi:MAG TPA: tRNA (adenosine(37)-N6)-threonylcarbamoyltransferase complex dimerization subunit type 1 TsaB [Gammaproteobacteria bacterium]|nr:tRNA (adenosine(37)-N6)-threonylcarbamoyltransferase complex dimerization subunit type 1 TsaB [Gammaproteobacteria bacterium]